MEVNLYKCTECHLKREATLLHQCHCEKFAINNALHVHGIINTNSKMCLNSVGALYPLSQTLS